MFFNKIAKINNEDISVIVQGPIVGSTNEGPNKYYTKICLESIRKHLPKATIILSTWRNSRITDLDYDILVESDDPGISIMGDSSPNCFRQIVSSIKGINECKTKYVAKMRTDMVLKSNHFLKYFIKYNLLPFDPKYKLLKQRVVTLTTCNPARRSKFPFTVSDWFFFGLTEDVKNIFDIPLVKKDQIVQEDGKSYRCESLYSAEQYIWFSFLSKYHKIPFTHKSDLSNNNITTSEKYFANNCIFLTAKQVKLDCLKHPGAAYAQIPCLSNSGLYTFNDYKKMLNKYANNKLLIVPNLLEETIYYIVYNLRFLVKKKNPKLHDIICRLVNRKNHP